MCISPWMHLLNSNSKVLPLHLQRNNPQNKQPPLKQTQSYTIYIYIMLHHVILKGEVDWGTCDGGWKTEQITRQILCPFRLPPARETHLLLIQSIWFLIKFEGEDLHDYIQIKLSTPGQYQVTHNLRQSQTRWGNTLSPLSFQSAAEVWDIQPHTLASVSLDCFEKTT